MSRCRRLATCRSRWGGAPAVISAGLLAGDLYAAGVDGAVEAFCEGLLLGAFRFDAHKTNAMTKLGLKSRIDIVRYALLQDWLQES